eukprot:s159_g10.t1
MMLVKSQRRCLLLVSEKSQTFRRLDHVDLCTVPRCVAKKSLVSLRDKTVRVRRLVSLEKIESMKGEQ